MEKHIFGRKITVLSQKITILIGFIFSLSLAFILIFGTILMFFEGEGFDVFIYIIGVVFLVIAIITLVLLLMRQGIIIAPSELYYSLFLFNIPFYKRRIDLINSSDVSVLTSGYKQQYTYAFNTIHDISTKLEILEVYLLNENHSKKTLVIANEKSDHTEKIVDLLVTVLGLKYKKYSPPRSKRRRR